MNKTRVSSQHARRGRPPKYLTFSYDQSADKTFSLAGRVIAESESLPLSDRLKVLAVVMPLALKRIPDRTISTVTSYNISEETAKAMLAEAQRNLLIYKELDEEAKREKEHRKTSDNHSTSDNHPC